MGSIVVSNLGKAYKQYRSRFGRLVEWCWPFGAPRHQLKWVLQDINFQIHPGEAVGLIGLNGAGKSTLLKLITGTTQPSSGSVQTQGRVAALLELGMGFHPDFNGRQNVMMAGQLIGMTVEEITRLMPEIEAFAEIGDYIEQPVRVYSSGMQMRLAFAIATAQRPDILIVDEALSVGDAYFQHKSFDRIRQFRREGTTLLIVSHDKSAIQSVCDRAILLAQGRLLKQGAPDEIMDFYNAMLAQDKQQNVRQEEHASGKLATISGTGEAKVVEIALLNAKGEALEVVDVGTPVTLKIRVRAYADIPRLVLGYMIKDKLGQEIYGTNTHLQDQPLSDVRAGQEFEFRIQFDLNLGPGNYAISTALVSSSTHLENNYEWRDLALVFNVVNLVRPHFIGCAWLDPDISIAQVSEVSP